MSFHPQETLVTYASHAAKLQIRTLANIDRETATAHLNPGGAKVHMLMASGPPDISDCPISKNND